MEIRNEICTIGAMMYNRQLISAYDGNISIRLSENSFITTPSGVCKGFLTPEMLVMVDDNGNATDDNTKPSTEIKMHLKVYEELQWVNAVVHAHPTYASIFAAMGKPLDRAYLIESIVTTGVVPIAPYATPSTDEVPASIAPYLHNCNALLLANHGALTWGRTLKEAYFLMESLEATAKVAFLAELAGGANEIPKEQVQKLKQLLRK